MLRLYPAHVSDRRRVLLGFTVAALLWAPSSLLAGKVILRIRVGNPIEKTQKVQVKSNLPAHIGTNSILSLAGLELGHDMGTDTYYVHKEIELAPKEIAVFDVELDDIWVLPADDLAKLRQRARELAVKLKDTKHAQEAEKLSRQVEKELEGIAASQEQNSIKAGARPVDHIRAYEVNLELLGLVRKDVGRLENLALSSGIDPGSLIGAAPAPPSRQPVDLAPADYKTAVIRITARNTSTTQSRKVSVAQELPPEIKAQDVVDAGGLDVRKDAKTGNVVVFRDSMEIGPGQTVPFDVKIRDKWNINAPRMINLRTNATELLAKVKSAGTFPSSEGDIRQAMDDLDRIEKERGPAQMGEGYVAFYRDQSARLDTIEDKILRIQSVLKPSANVSKWGFATKPPSMTTTWLIIYIILGFLALLTVLVSVRSLGRTREEKMKQGPGAE